MTDEKRDPIFDDVEKIVAEFIRNTQEELTARWNAWKPEVAEREYHEVVAALLARQVALAIQIARNPLIWNSDGAPVLLRAMADVFINLAWIFGDPAERARKFVLHGLGQLKLQLEHRKAALAKGPADPREEELIKLAEEWLQSQRLLHLTNVNLGSWAETTTRKMAEEAGCLDFYNHVYIPLSGAAHSMWQHVGRYNMRECRNPLHRPHRAPFIADEGIVPFFFHAAAKHLRETFALFDEKTGVKVDVPSAYDVLEKRFEEFDDKMDDEPESVPPRQENDE